MALQRFRVAREADAYVLLDLGEPGENGQHVHDDSARVVDTAPFTAAGKGELVARAAGLNAENRRG